MLKMNKTKEIQSASMQLHKQINTINTFNNTSPPPPSTPEEVASTLVSTKTYYTRFHFEKDITM